MCYSISIQFFCMFCNMQCLHQSLSTYTKRISIILQYITKYKIFNNTVIIAFYRIYCSMRFYAEAVSMCFNFLQFFFIKATGVYNNTMYFIALVFGEVLYTKGGIKTATET